MKFALVLGALDLSDVAFLHQIAYLICGIWCRQLSKGCKLVYGRSSHGINKFDAQHFHGRKRILNIYSLIKNLGLKAQFKLGVYVRKALFQHPL